ncbi:MAG TPA: hypothetical protein P5309_01985 [Syntrophomonadaceae bacterium]|jgi:hypothetical protein|nr:hypothetical protein [Syntrophomonadaceae bacterium]
MRKPLGVLSDWYDAYLDVLDGLYGTLETEPQSVLEVGEEWQRVFGAMAKNQPEIAPFMGGSDAFLADLEELHGEWNLHPELSVQETCEEWQRCFGSSISLQVRNKPTAGKRLGSLASAS